MSNKSLVMWTALALALTLIIWTRVEGLHLTEGELVVEYWWRWLLAIALLLGGWFVGRAT